MKLSTFLCLGALSLCAGCGQSGSSATGASTSPSHKPFEANAHYKGTLTDATSACAMADGSSLAAADDPARTGPVAIDLTLVTTDGEHFTLTRYGNGDALCDPLTPVQAQKDGDTHATLTPGRCWSVDGDIQVNRGQLTSSTDGTTLTVDMQLGGTYGSVRGIGINCTEQISGSLSRVD